MVCHVLPQVDSGMEFLLFRAVSLSIQYYDFTLPSRSCDCRSRVAKVATLKPDPNEDEAGSGSGGKDHGRGNDDGCLERAGSDSSVSGSKLENDGCGFGFLSPERTAQ